MYTTFFSPTTHIYHAENAAVGIQAQVIKKKDKPGSLEAKGFCAITSRRRMMSWRAENRTCRFRGVVEGQARGKP